MWALPLFGDRKPLEVTRTPFTESNARLSPDGRWMAYQSTETGRNEILVQPFPGAGPRSQVSVDGGTLPRWRRDGRELFYLASDGSVKMMSVTPNGARLDISSARPLFQMPAVFGPYETSADGQAFLVNIVVSEAPPITVILNWKPPGN